MKNIFQEYFYYNKRERNGILVLSFLCALIFFIPKLYQSYYVDSDKMDFKSYKMEIETFQQAFEEKKSSPSSSDTNLTEFDPNVVTGAELISFGVSEKLANTIINFRNKGGRFFKKEDLKRIYGLRPEIYDQLALYVKIRNNIPKPNLVSKPKIEAAQKTEIQTFEFDPNRADKKTLLSLGFPQKAANNLLKYREKGGTIRNKAMLSRIYGIDDTLFQRLEPFILILDHSDLQTSKEKNTEREDLIIDINKAGLEEWQKLKGIGPYFAKGIVGYREKLGGFYSIDQVGNTYGLPDSTFQSIKPKLSLSPVFRKINVNRATVEELMKHPYLNYKEARLIVNFRKQHGDYNNLNELGQIKIIEQKSLEKILPYLKLSD